MIKLELSEQELQALVGLMNAGVQATGLRSVKDAAVLIDKIEKAAEAAGKADDNVINFDEKDAANG